MAAEIKILQEKCTGCGVCANLCPVEVFEVVDGKSKTKKPENCVVCRACENTCPTEAIMVEEII